ncbi:MAG: peptidase, partial [Muribaculaceae bacterium]|nr:peptidase [Muribaculaceae bacterium]
MKKRIIKLLLAAVVVSCGFQANAQLRLGKALDGAKKAADAITLSDEKMAEYVKESIDWMDKHNPVPGENDPYTKRLRRLTEGITEVDGIPLNFKVYDVV